MFVVTAKVSKTKIALLITGLVAIVVAIAILASCGRKKPGMEATEKNADCNEARITFLSQYGWQVGEQPMQTQQVRIPSEEGNEVFDRYNELQKSQGYDLTQFGGKTVSRYVYEVLNYPDTEGPVYATLFVADGTVIGGDITDASPQGAVHGFQKP